MNKTGENLLFMGVGSQEPAREVARLPRSSASELVKILGLEHGTSGPSSNQGK